MYTILVLAGADAALKTPQGQKRGRAAVQCRLPEEGPLYYLCQVQGVVYCSKRDGCIGACKPAGNKRPL